MGQALTFTLDFLGETFPAKNQQISEWTFAKIGSKIDVTQEMVWLDGENMNQWRVLRMEMHTENWFIMLGVETQKSCLHIFFHGDV